SVFARKNYFYPDLPKGYQISQYEIPVVKGGALTIATDDGEKAIHLTRAHLEEDAGKSLHEGLPATVGDVSGIDLNRAGTPLLEIDDAWIAHVRSGMPELPEAMRARLAGAHGISDYDAAQLTSSLNLARYYDDAVAALPATDAAACKLVANWVLGEVSAAVN